MGDALKIMLVATIMRNAQDLLNNQTNYSAMIYFLFEEEENCTESRDFWEFPRCKALSNFIFNQNGWTNRQFRGMFRMKRQIFNNLTNELRPFLLMKNTAMRSSTSVEIQLAVFLFYSSTKVSLEQASNFFGVSGANVSRIIRRVSLAIQTKMSVLIKFPTPAEMSYIASDFELKSHIPQCIGAIDGCHIPIQKPRESAKSYFNRKNFYSINML